MNQLKSKVAIITGGGSGIGAATAERIAEQGASVMITDINGSAAEQTARVIQQRGQSAQALAQDVADPDAWATVFTETAKAFGPANVLVNNAGITRDNILLRMKEDEWEDIISTNLSSIYKMSKSVLRGMIKKRSGRIISITSVVGAMGNAGQSNYGAAKAGIIGFTKSLAREVGVRGITVNAIAPGFIETDMTDSLPDDQKEALASQIPMGRLGTPNEVAQAVLFLAGESGSYITGQTIHVNGGMYTV